MLDGLEAVLDPVRPFTLSASTKDLCTRVRRRSKNKGQDANWVSWVGVSPPTRPSSSGSANKRRSALAACAIDSRCGSLRPVSSTPSGKAVPHSASKLPPLRRDGSKTS